jgi:DNA-directed RNA polymerase specialized sigma24 family protein
VTREAALDWSEIYERLARRPERPDPLAWEALEQRVRAWARDDEVAAVTCAEVWRTFNLARGGAAFEGFVQGRFVEAARPREAPPLGGAIHRVPTGAVRESPDVSDAGAAMGDARVERLRACLEELPGRNPRHHRALTLLYADRATVQEAADVLAVDTWTIRTLVARARLVLAQCLERAERKRSPGEGGRPGAADGAKTGRSDTRPGRPGARSGQSGSKPGRQHKGRPPAGRRPR